MSENNLLSIIIPVYNTEEYLSRCLESLVNQSYKNLEIIIINDNSTDKSEEIIQSFTYDKRVQNIRLNSNHGTGYSRNVGLQMARGKYITFVDSDDWVDLDLYHTMISQMKNDNSEIAICGVKNEQSNQKSSSYRYYYAVPNCISSSVVLDLLTKTIDNNYFISPVVWNKVYTDKTIKEHNIVFMEDSYWEDDIFSFQVFLKDYKVSIVPNAFYHYFQRYNSITNQISKKHIDTLIDSFIHLRCELSIDPNSKCKPPIVQQYQAFLDRSVCVLMNMILSNEINIKTQKEYINYFVERFTKNFSIRECVEYLDVDRIKRLFT